MIIENNTIKMTEEDKKVLLDLLRQKGKWIEQTDINSKLYGWYKCSECGAVIGTKTNFCSECGADMRGEEE